MRIARAVAFAIAIAAPLAIFLWLNPTPKDGAPVDVAKRGPRDATSSTPSAAPPAPPPATAPSPEVAPSREPAASELSATGKWQVELDLRGPGDEKLAQGRILATPSVRELPPKERFAGSEASELAWRRDAATLALRSSVWTIVAEAESDETPDAIPCGDLVSHPMTLDPKSPPPMPLVVRLHARSGLFGRILGLSAATGSAPDRLRCGVRWQRIDPGRSIPARELEFSGHDARLVLLADEGLAYVVHDLAPGRYAISVRGDPIGPLESPVEVEVGDAMVRRDLSLATIDATTMLHVVVQGLLPEELGLLSFFWVGGGIDHGAGDRTLVRKDAPGSFWLTPAEPVARSQLQRVLDGTLAAGEQVAVALARDGAVVAAQALTSGQHDVRFVCDAPARLRVRFAAKRLDGTPRLDLALAPADAAGLLDVAPAMSLVMQIVELKGDEATSAPAEPNASPRSEWTWKGLIPGNFILVTWGQLHSELRHGEVWWPLARCDVVVKGGEQELEVDLPPLHPLEIRFDRERFGKEAHVQVVLRSYPKWPLLAIPDQDGIARFELLPDGDYTVTVVGDMAGERDFTMPGTNMLRVEPTRREEH